MNRPARLASLLLAATMLAAGCGSAAGQTAAPASPATPPSLATSLATATGTWAVTVMGGSAASHNNFWQLFVRPAGASTWRLATPPGVASNGGLVLTGLASGSVLAGFRPSQDLAYSPLAITKDNGKAWSPGLLDAGLADVPGALAADPSADACWPAHQRHHRISGTGGTRWIRLVTRRELAASPPEGGASQAASPRPRSARPGSLAGRGLRRPGTAGIFSQTGRTWQLTGPALPAAYAHQAITVLRLTTTGDTTTALLAAEPGRRNACWPAGLRRRRALDTVTAAADERRHPDLGIVRAWQQPRITLSDRHAAAITTARDRGGSCQYCRQAPRPRAGSLGGWEPWPSQHPAHHLAGRAGCPSLVSARSSGADRRSSGAGHQVGRVQDWLAPPVHDQICAWVPGVVDQPVSSRHFPDSGFSSAPSLCGTQTWAPVPLQV